MGQGSERKLAFTCGAALGLTGVLIPSCRAPEEMIVQFTTDVPCSSVNHLDVGVASLPWRADADIQAGTPAVTARRCASGVIGKLVIARSDPERAALIAVLSYRGGPSARDCLRNQLPDCIVSRRRIAFVANTVLNLSVGMLAECKGIACTILSTCQKGGRCLSSDVDCAEDGTCRDSEEVATDVPPEPVTSDASTDAMRDAARDSSIAQESGAPTDGGMRDASDGSFRPSNLACGTTACLGTYCCLRSATGGGSRCVVARADCDDMMSVRIACYRNSDCPPTAEYCVWSGTHGGVGGSGYGYTVCSPAISITNMPGQSEMMCATQQDCIDAGYGTGSGYGCLSHTTPDPIVPIQSCSNMN